MSLFESTKASNGCLSALAFDQLLAGELPLERAQDARAHLSTCSACAARWQVLEQEQQRFAERPLPVRLRARAAPPAVGRPRRSSLRAGALAAMAAGLVGILTLSLLRTVDGEGGTRNKGGAAVDFHRKHDGVVTRLDEGGFVEPGDHVQVVTSFVGPRHVALFSLDGVGKASMYFPATAKTAPQLPGDSRPLPVSTELDDTLGEERLFLLSCDVPRPLGDELRRLQLERRLPVPEGCTVATRRFRKVAKSE